MVIANGFITKDIPLAFEEAKKLIKGKELRYAVMPPLCTMTYFVSDIGEVFGCQQMKNFVLTKQKKVEKRYKSGCNIRYSIGQGNERQLFMQYLMYATFVSQKWDDSLKLKPKDGNQYNYNIDNLEIKQEDTSVFYTNINILKDVYAKYFNHVAWRIVSKYEDIQIDDAKDISANTFYQICKTPYNYNPDYFVALWVSQAKKRAIDYLSVQNRFKYVLFNDDGEERFGNQSKDVEIADIWRFIRGNKRKQYLQMSLQGYTDTEIAKQHRVTRSTVSSEIHRAITELKRQFCKDIAV